jgi:RimJ/RimL family protein N-acetyltransferase
MLKGESIFLRILSPCDVGEKYLNWMHDDDVIQHLESRWRAYSMEDLKEYVRVLNLSQQDVFFGIFVIETREHIGNIKIGNIDQIHRFADVGLLIGEASARGKGYGTEAILLACRYAFEELNLNKIIAGIYAVNIGSFKAFLKAGFREVGRLHRHRFCKGDYVDEILVEKCR